MTPGRPASRLITFHCRRRTCGDESGSYCFRVRSGQRHPEVTPRVAARAGAGAPAAITLNRRALRLRPLPGGGAAGPQAVGVAKERPAGSAPRAARRPAPFPHALDTDRPRPPPGLRRVDSYESYYVIDNVESYRLPRTVYYPHDH
jgi:hypothetical protein